MLTNYNQEKPQTFAVSFQNMFFKTDWVLVIFLPVGHFKKDF